MLLTLVVQKWGTEEVAAWLDLLNLGEYKEIFIRHDIRGAELLHLERRDLKVFPLCYSSVLKFSSCKTDSFLLHLSVLCLQLGSWYAYVIYIICIVLWPEFLICF